MVCGTSHQRLSSTISKYRQVAAECLACRTFRIGCLWLFIHVVGGGGGGKWEGRWGGDQTQTTSMDPLHERSEVR